MRQKGSPSGISLRGTIMRIYNMDLEQRIQNIEERNARVEGDKAWETSYLRIGTILLVTYIVACGVLIAIGNDSPFRNALIPVVGYFLSIQSLPFIKASWLRRYLSSRGISRGVE